MFSFRFQQPERVSEKEVCQMMARLCVGMENEKIRKAGDCEVTGNWILDRRDQWMLRRINHVPVLGGFNYEYELQCLRHDLDKSRGEMTEGLFKSMYGHHGGPVATIQELKV